MTTPEPSTAPPEVRWEEAFRAEMAHALNLAWDDFVGDTGCFPDCITMQGGRLDTVISADFWVGNFVRYAADWLLRSPVVAAALTPPPTPAEIADVIRPNLDLDAAMAELLAERLAAWLRSRLVPLPPEPTYETVQVFWSRAFAGRMAVTDCGPAVVVEFDADGRIVLVGANGDVAVVDPADGTVPVRREVPR